MDKYTLERIQAAEKLVDQKKKQSSGKKIPLAQVIPITEKGSFHLYYHGAKVDKAILRVGTRVISVIVPNPRATASVDAGATSAIKLNFLGESKLLHAGLGNYKIEVEFHFDPETGIPSLVLGCGAEPTVTPGEPYCEDVTVTSADGQQFPVEIVYLPQEIGLRKK